MVVKRKRVSVVLAIFIVFCFTSYVFAAYLPHIDGKPDSFEPGNSQGYFIWQDKEGLHVRTTTFGKKHIFSGVIRTDGKFRDVFGKATMADDSFHVSDNQDKITFQFTDTGESSGIDFYFKNGTYLTFSLSMDGDEINSNDIFIGKDGWHPGSYKFTIRHDEPRDWHGDEGTVIVVGDPWFWTDWWPIHYHPDPGPGPHGPGPDPDGPHGHGW
jgi:hypothetical protein